VSPTTEPAPPDAAPPSPLRRLLRPFEAFIQTEALGGTVLILASVVALAWANSPFAGGYDALWGAEATVGVPGFALTKPLLLWVNDLLMAVFFLLVGLEIKRELLVGELDTPRKAVVPVVAALGGMVVPALVFRAVARDGPASAGWGIPMATDIAFALGCVKLLGGRVPAALVVFLTALAIVDDLGAILVIALFYSEGVSGPALALAAAFVLGLVLMNRLGVRRPGLYVLAGLPLWVAALKSGIHPTVAGVIVGLSIPARALATDEAGTPSPLERLEHALHPWVAYGVVPVFALANAGVSFGGVAPSSLGGPAALGSFLGLVVGKQVGVFGATWAAVRLGLATLPEGVGWRHVYGASLMAGIGFTMSLFVAALAYGEGTAPHVEAKLGILAASLVCAVAGMLVLTRGRAEGAPGDGDPPPPP
jgi:NhaA family Na+:H+ antiporter